MLRDNEDMSLRFNFLLVFDDAGVVAQLKNRTLLFDDFVLCFG